MTTEDQSFNHDVQRLTVSVAEATKLTGVGRTFLYEALNSGALRSLKIGKRRLIAVDALRAWLAAHEETL